MNNQCGKNKEKIGKVKPSRKKAVKAMTIGFVSRKRSGKDGFFWCEKLDRAGRFESTFHTSSCCTTVNNLRGV